MAAITPKQNFMDSCVDTLVRRLNQDLVKMEKMNGEREDFQPVVEKMVGNIIVNLHEKLIEAFPRSEISYQNTTPFIPESHDGTKFIIVPLGGLKHINHTHDEAFIAIAFIDYKGVLQDAMVFNPFKDQKFFASNNNGAFSQELRLRTSLRKESCDFVVYANKKLAEPKDFSKVVDLITTEATNNQALRTTDASLLDLMLVLGGKKDAFIGTGLTMQEVLIAKLFAQEAGAVATDFTSKEITEKTTSIVVTNSKLHATKVLPRLK
jgi:myo-inositol-1(or 4)-monophosphatase